MIVGGVKAVVSGIIRPMVSVFTIVHHCPFVAGVGGVDDRRIIRTDCGAFTPAPGIGNGAT